MGVCFVFVCALRYIHFAWQFLCHIVHFAFHVSFYALSPHVTLSHNHAKITTSSEAVRPPPSSALPRLWLSPSYSNVKPLRPYISHLVHRLRMFASWIDNGTPVAAWLPAFCFTRSFLTAVLQNFARKYKLAVDSLKFSYKVLADVPATKPEDGCCIHGLYLDGGRWNANHQCLADPQPKVCFSVCRHTRT